MEIDADLPTCIQAKFKSDSGEEIGSLLDLPLNITKDQLTLICNAFLQEVIIFFFSIYFKNHSFLKILLYFLGG